MASTACASSSLWLRSPHCCTLGSAWSDNNTVKVETSFGTITQSHFGAFNGRAQNTSRYHQDSSRRNKYKGGTNGKLSFFKFKQDLGCFRMVFPNGYKSKGSVHYSTSSSGGNALCCGRVGER